VETTQHTQLDWSLAIAHPQPYELFEWPHAGTKMHITFDLEKGEVQLSGGEATASCRKLLNSGVLRADLAIFLLSDFRLAQIRAFCRRGGRGRWFEGLRFLCRTKAEPW
jgi:hypothetical protein